MYNPKSLKAEEFICHQEVLDTLAYADANRNNPQLVDQVLNKARERKGLNHREAMILLDCDIPEKNREIFELAEQIKKDYYGNRIVMFAPLYLSNYCVNGCVYCPYHAKNKHIPRRKLTQEEVAKRVGKSRSAVANSLRLLKLPEDVKTLVEDGGLSAGHARALLGISDEKLLSETAAKAADGKLTVRAVEKIAADSEKPEKRTKFSHKDSFYKEIEISLESRLGRRVTVTAGKNKGTLNLEFYDKDDLSALAQKLTKE